MSLKYKTKGFVFKKENKTEASQIFSFFTKDFGRLEASAKAIRKITSKLRADTDMFYFSEIEFIQGKNNKILTDSTKIENFNNIYKDLNKFKLANQIAYVLDNFIKGQEKDEKIFNLIINFFEKINSESLKAKNYQLLFNYFFWNFLCLQGYSINVENCALCKAKLNPYNIYFSVKDGGAVCKNCSTITTGAQKTNTDIVKILRLILNKEWDTLSKLKVGENSQKLLNNVCKNAIYAFCPVHN
jgi:DNA repair protein RecO (recombination protein O)